MKAAARSDEQEEDEEGFAISKGKIGGMRQEIEAQEQILLKRRELEETMKQLKRIRRNKYQQEEGD